MMHSDSPRAPAGDSVRRRQIHERIPADHREDPGDRTRSVELPASGCTLGSLLVAGAERMGR
jgi:hypothetical protein